MPCSTRASDTRDRNDHRSPRFFDRRNRAPPARSGRGIRPPAAARHRQLFHHLRDDVCRSGLGTGGALRSARDRLHFDHERTVMGALVRDRRLRPRYLLTPDLRFAHRFGDRIHLVLHRLVDRRHPGDRFGLFRRQD